MKLYLKRILRWVGRKIRPKPSPHPNWIQILKQDWPRWRSTVKSAQGPPILIATSLGGFYPGTIVESLLAVALTLRGAKVHILLCDKLLPACSQAECRYVFSHNYAFDGPSKSLCRSCFTSAFKMYRSLQLPIHMFSQFLSGTEQGKARMLCETIRYTDISNYRMDGLAIGEHAFAGALRFYARGNLDQEPFGEAVLRHYFCASLLTAYVIRRLLGTYQFTSACFHHGIYVPQGLIGEVARQQNIRIVNWNIAYRKKCFIFSHGDTYHHTLLSEPTTNWENIPWTTEMETVILDYLKSRWHGTQDWILFHESPEEELSTIATELGVDFSRPCIGMLTNVMWDAQIHYRANAFPNMLEWVLQTIKYFVGRPELQLLIRVHPAEIRGTVPSCQPIVAEIRRVYPILPHNIFLIPPESRVSTYAVMAQCNSVIIYGTKTGVELTSVGIPVIVGGEAWIRNKGVTMDASTAEEYFHLLDQLPLPHPLDESTTQRAQKYAYHFFFRRMIPLGMMMPIAGWPHYQMKINNIDDLLPGKDHGLDVICNGILHGTEFIYPAESYLA